MAEHSEIAWTHHTFNPVKGCQKVSEGCKHCYAEADTKRYGLKLWGPGAPRERTRPDYWKQPRKWNKRAEASGVRERVFCASWADVGEDHPDWVQPRRDLVQLMEATPALDWLLLTKRPESLVRLFRDAGWSGAWPENVWAGCTVENQTAADERIPRLLDVPAAIRFLSCEPLLGPVNLAYGAFNGADSLGSLEGIHWVIAGGESGPHARPFDLAWARSLRDQCRGEGVAFFLKQLGANAWEGPPELAARYRTEHRAGADPEEWPLDLRVQQFPEASRWCSVACMQEEET